MTETTKQVVPRDKDSVKNRDIQHTIERSESQEDKAALISSVKGGSFSMSIIFLLLKSIIFLSILFVIYMVATSSTEGVTPVDQIVDSINSAQVSPTTGVESGAPAPPYRESAP